jgi:hypothetical protein
LFWCSWLVIRSIGLVRGLVRACCSHWLFWCYSGGWLGRFHAMGSCLTAFFSPWGRFFFGASPPSWGVLMTNSVDIIGLLPVKRKPVLRQERCETCYWMERSGGSETGMECHGGPPTCHVLMVPHPLDRSKSAPRPLCVWPPVYAAGFCRNWEGRTEVPVGESQPVPA